MSMLLVKTSLCVILTWTSLIHSQTLYKNANTNCPADSEDVITMLQALTSEVNKMKSRHLELSLTVKDLVNSGTGSSNHVGYLINQISELNEKVNSLDYLKEEILTLKMKNEELSEKVTTLEKQKTTLHQKVNSLEYQNNELSKSVQQFQNHQNDSSSLLQSLKTQNIEISQKVTSIENRQILISNKQNELSGEIIYHEGLIKSLMSGVTAISTVTRPSILPTTSQIQVTGSTSTPIQGCTEVAFYAVSTYPHNSGVIVFDQVYTNLGNMYDGNNGTFTACVSGIYAFSWNVEIRESESTATLAVNDVIKGSVWADSSSSSSFAVLELKKGDRVNVKAEGSALGEHTAFSGWLHSNGKDDKTTFYASIQGSASFSYDSSTPYNFDNIYTDPDRVYSPHTGHFKARKPGLYAFAVSIVCARLSTSYIYIQNSTDYTLRSITPINCNGNYQWDSTGSMIVAYLNTDDRVFVGDGRAFKTSMFAGWMVAPGQPTTYPAFIASLVTDSSASPLVFGKTHVHPYHGYSPVTGIFIADRNGVYVFFMNIKGHTSSLLSALKVNSLEMGGTGLTSYSDGSSVAVLALSTGDQVSVNIISGTADEGQSMFCGYLLFEN